MENSMHQDVKINCNGEKFKFRVAGIIEHKDKLLLMQMDGNPFVCFPGGHVELLEDTKTAAERELSEELYFDVEVTDLLYIHENFFEGEGHKFHELCFYYKARPKDQNIKMDELLWEEIDKGRKRVHKFTWYTKEQLKTEWAEPKVIVKKYLKDSSKFEHFITRD